MALKPVRQQSYKSMDGERWGKKNQIKEREKLRKVGQNVRVWICPLSAAF